jgi:hypothetical protein
MVSPAPRKQKVSLVVDLWCGTLHRSTGGDPLSVTPQALKRNVGTRIGSNFR